MLAERVLPLSGVHNFRDYGGYAVEGGGRLRDGILWRSAHHAEAADDDLTAIDGLAIETIIDLRGDDEREQYPCRRSDNFAGRVLFAGGTTAGLAPHLQAAVGAIDVIIPPSIPMIVYGSAAEESVARLYAAGVVPGLLIAGMIATYVIWRARREGFGAGEPFDWRRFLHATGRSVWALGAPVIILGGIYGGVFSPTEGAAVGTVALLAIGLAQRSLTWATLRTSILNTASTTAMIFVILMGSEIFNAFLALSGLPAAMAEYVAAQGWPPYVVLTAMLAFYILLGAVMDELAMMLLTLPVFFPIVAALDFGLPSDEVAIWFGILVLIVVGIGLTAPPIGLNVFVISAIAKDVPITQTYRGVLPFIMMDIFRLALVACFPILALGLVRLLS